MMENINKIIKSIKILNDFSDDFDKKLEIYVTNSVSAICNFIDEKELPEQLEYIVMEMAQSKFNKAGDEGISQRQEEGLTLSFTSNDLKPYLLDLNRYLDNKKASVFMGKAVSFD